MLTIIGTGADISRCRKLADRLPRARVEFLGRLPHVQTLAKIAEAHVLAAPSQALETYGLTLIEALSAGTNVLASNRVALAEIVEDAGVGFLFDVDAPATLARELQAIRKQHADGSLNRFHIVPFLEQRSEARHASGLLRLYDNDAESYAAAALVASRPQPKGCGMARALSTFHIEVPRPPGSETASKPVPGLSW